MRNLSILTALALTTAATSLIACGDDDTTSTTAGTGGSGASSTSTMGTGAAGGSTGNACGDLNGPITESCTLTAAGGPWLIQGVVTVEDGAVLTIEAGTTITGEAATSGTLVIKRGGQINAVGTADAPIVFTSELPEGQRAAGDWGGLILLGRAPITLSGGATEATIEGLTSDELYGGNDPMDSSGTLQYVRIEYSGVDLGDGDEINGLTFGAVGAGTTIDHVMVRNTLDDGFEWFGGTVNASHLIAYNAGDDYFDADQGFSGNLQFLFGISNTPITGDPNGFEMDSIKDNADTATDTRPNIWNVTLCGPSGGANAGFGMVLREGFKGEINNALVNGFDAGLSVRTEMDETNTTAPTINTSIFFSQTLVDANYAALSQSTYDDGNANLSTDPGIPNCVGTTPDPVPAVGTVGSTPPAGFDTSADYVGAFSAANNWATGAWVAY